MTSIRLLCTVQIWNLSQIPCKWCDYLDYLLTLKRVIKIIRNKTSTNQWEKKKGQMTNQMAKSGLIKHQTLKLKYLHWCVWLIISGHPMLELDPIGDVAVLWVFTCGFVSAFIIFFFEKLAKQFKWPQGGISMQCSILIVIKNRYVKLSSSLYLSISKSVFIS